MTATVEAEMSIPAVPHRPRRWAIAVAVLSGLLLASGGLIAGLAIDGSGSPTTTAPKADGSSVTLGTVESVEPVAAVAAALSPSVVQIERADGVGSGFVYDASGLILTAAHVVDGVSSVTVVLPDGERVDGTVIGADQGYDVAVVRIEADGLVAAPLALGSDLAVGQTAIALGSPFGLEGSVTSGVISAVGRNVAGSDGRVRTVIQTDAPINPGNSGGPLADREGRVIGINDFIFSPSGGNAGVGFATPIGIAHEVAARLVAGETIGTGFLGVAGTAPESGIAGALITEVVPGSPAESAGIAVGDLVIEIDGEQVRSMEDLAAVVQQHEPGATLQLTIVHGSTSREVSVILVERPAA